MSCSLLTINRSYVKYSIYTIYRNISTFEHHHHHQHSNQLIFHRNFLLNSIEKNDLNLFRLNSFEQKRSITLHVPHSEEKKSSPKINDRMPFQFPPGNPNDKPKIEHLRFIENQLIHIVKN